MAVSGPSPRVQRKLCGFGLIVWSFFGLLTSDKELSLRLELGLGARVLRSSCVDS